MDSKNDKTWFVGLYWRPNIKDGLGRPADEVEVFAMNTDDGWSSDNPNGWTYQDVQHGYDHTHEVDSELSARKLAEEMKAASREWWAKRQ